MQGELEALKTAMARAITLDGPERFSSPLLSLLPPGSPEVEEQMRFSHSKKPRRQVEDAAPEKAAEAEPAVVLAKGTVAG